MDMSLSKLWEIVQGREAWSAAVMWLQTVRHDLATKQEQQSLCRFKYSGEEGISGAFCVAIRAWKCSVLTHFLFLSYLIGLNLQYNVTLKGDSENPCFIFVLKGKDLKSDVLLKLFKVFFFLYIFLFGFRKFLYKWIPKTFSSLK